MTEARGEPLLAAVVIARNEERTIAASLASARRALDAAGGGDLVLVDSASTDGTVRRALAAGCRVVRIRRASRLCPSAARRIGASRTRSRHVLFLDGDCELEEGFLPKALTALQADPTLGVVAGRRRDFHRTRSGVVPSPTEYYERRRAPDGGPPAYGGCALYRRAALDAAGSFHPFLRAKEEEELAYRILAAGYRIEVLPVPMIRHTTVPREGIGRLLRSLRHGFFVGRGEAARALWSAGRRRVAFRGLDRTLFMMAHLALGAAALALVPRGVVWPAIAWASVSLPAFAVLAVRGRSLRRAFYYPAEWLIQGAALAAGFPRRLPPPAAFRWEGEETDPAEAAGRPPRVLLVGPRPAPPVAGGVEKGVALLLNSVLARRTSMRLFDSRRPHDPTRPWRERILYMSGRLHAFGHELRAHPPDLVHLKTSSGVNFHQNALYARAARRRGLPVVLQIHSGRFEAFYRESPALLRPWIRRTLEGATRVVALSRGWADRIAAIAPAARVAVVPNGLDDAELALLGRGGEIRRPQVLFLGAGSAALNRDKGLDDLLAVLPAAARRHPDVRWVLAGLEHPEPIRTRLLDAGLIGAPEGPTVSCLGRVAGDERAALLTGSTILVLPSRFENMPNVLLEAMAAGLGVVATDVGAMPEMLGYGEGGLLIPAGDRTALAEALEGLLASPARVRGQGRRNRQVVSRDYTMRVVEERLEEVYRDAADWPTAGRETGPESSEGTRAREEGRRLPATKSTLTRPGFEP